MDQEQLLARWQELLREFESRNERAVAELHQSWTDVKTILDRSSSALEEASGSVDVGSGIDPLELLLGQEAEIRYCALAELLERRRPAQRAIAALANHDASIEDLLTPLPPIAELAPQDAFAMAGFSRVPLLGRVRYTRSHPKRRFRFRDCVRTGLYRANLTLSEAEGEILLVIARATLHALAAWQLWRQTSLKRIASGSASEPDLGITLLWWRTRYSALTSAGDTAFQSLGTRTGHAFQQLRRSILRQPGSSRRIAKLGGSRRSCLQYWSRLQRAVHTQAELETESLRVAREALNEGRRLIHSLEREHEQLIAELDGVLLSIRGWSANAAADSFPPPQAHLVSALERADDWLRTVTLHARQRLPVTVESVMPKFPLPARRVRWRLFEPQAAFLTAAADYGRELLLGPLREAETSHRAIVREIEHAREVFAFGRETAGSGDPESEEVALDAVGNAAALLEYQRRMIRDLNNVVGPGVSLALVQLLIEYYATLDRDRVSLLARAGHRRGLRFADLALGSFHTTVQWGAKRTERLLADAYRASLRQLGVLPPPQADREPIEHTPDLGGILSLTVGARDLPAIYRRLFRLAPVEDPRFLVGRREEMTGIADAVERWLDGKTAAVMVIGARGSGKTSLLNCAMQRFPPDLDAVRGQFSERVTTVEAMEASLCRMLAVRRGGTLSECLMEGRRVVVLEEFERTFLRAIDGFSAVRHFIDLVQSTAERVLWIVSMNESSYKLLRAVCGVDRFFSHRINAMSVSQDAMVATILQRHNLSGLRLEFAPVPLSDPRVSRLKSFLGLMPEPQQLFFDSLYRQSEGTYRSAFELWQDCIKRIEAGTIHMAQPLSPTYEPLDRELNLEDCFALQEILQHGSMTTDELALVLRLPVQAAGRRTNRMLQLQILEPEPGGPGFRVRPQAGRFIREALHKRNLV